MVDSLCFVSPYRSLEREVEAIDTGAPLESLWVPKHSRPFNVLGEH